MRGVARGAGAAYGDLGKSTDATSRLWGVCVPVKAQERDEEFLMFWLLHATYHALANRRLPSTQNLHSCAMHAYMHNACSGRHSMEGKLGPEPARRPKDQQKTAEQTEKNRPLETKKTSVCATTRIRSSTRPMSDLMNPWGSGTGTVQCTWTQGPLGMTSR